MKRIKVYEGFAECKTVEDKRKNAKNLITRINRQLESGKDPATKKYIALPQNSTNSEISKAGITKTFEREHSAPTLTLEHCLNEMVKENKGHWRKKTTGSYQSQLNIFFEWFKLEKLEYLDVVSFTKDHAQSFINYLSNELKSHNTTRNNYTINFKSFFKKLKKKGVIENSVRPPVFRSGSQKKTITIGRKAKEEDLLLLGYIYSFQLILCCFLS